jgi:hypothetical protein
MRAPNPQFLVIQTHRKFHYEADVDLNHLLG